MTRIAYLSHVDSRWIKQRPHFLAEEIGARAGMSVAFFCSAIVKRSLLVKDQRLSVPVFRLPLLPQRLRGRLWFLDFVLSRASALLLVIFWRPDVLIVTHARHYELARLVGRFNTRVFYDCMDINRLFPDVVNRDIANEARLVDLAAGVFCSSGPIEEEIRRMGTNAQIVSVPNALDGRAMSHVRQHATVNAGVVRYVGTVASWFDRDAILDLVESMPVNVEIIGPLDSQEIVHDRVTYRGVMTHGNALEEMWKADVLVLPFVVTELIAAVDPVKVYEYIATGRPVVCVDYPQLDHFGGLISRYRQGSGLSEAIASALGRKSVPAEELAEFVKLNSWSARAERIAELL
ncbi:glycosyltransferase [Frondihabitans sp. Leaf304]|uniref:glycosyltransferase n=1 Tax=Frondihabitans sp. Leaf304 TaxID=1736329 RepID=UPI0012F94BBD|nr:glycosyltransferase [Frondihabitans sp. Leaf304]